MKEHVLKIELSFFEPILDGRKTFELRKNDRDYKVNDTLVLCEYSITKNHFTGRSVKATVTYVLPGGFNGLDSEYCILGIEACPEQSNTLCGDTTFECRHRKKNYCYSLDECSLTFN